MKSLVLAAISLSTLLASFLPAQQLTAAASAPKPSAVAHADLDRAIHDYLLAHPEVVLESVRAYDVHQKQIAADKVRDKVRANLAELTSDGTAPVFTSSKASPAPVTVVEFFDYRCGFCKKTAGTVLGLGATPGVRVVYKELPILGTDSMLAAQAALAARAQGGYDKLHNAMLASDVPLTAPLIDKLAADNGFDVARLKTDMKSPAVNAEIARNLDLAQKLEIEATPTFVVGDQLVSGALTPQAFNALIETARGKKMQRLEWKHRHPPRSPPARPFHLRSKPTQAPTWRSPCRRTPPPPFHDPLPLLCHVHRLDR